jgi:hypothetical protein
MVAGKEEILNPLAGYMTGFRVLVISVLAFAAAAHTATRIQVAPVPEEMQSHFFTVKVEGQSVDVAHAASNYEFVNFDTTGPAEISITAAEPGFWDRGVDIEPWRLGLRAARDGQTIRFRIPGPVKLAISRPGDFLNHARMLFLFAGTPPPPPPQGANVTIVPAGVHRVSLNPKSGETIYLAPGSYIFGSLNLWQVRDVKVLGRGTIVYDGPQNPEKDEGYMTKPDWHCIDSYQASNVEINGVTCIVRSRTWMIQLKDSTGFTFDDLRVVGGHPSNANQDGIDFVGSGNSVVRNSFFRASDDIIAVLGNFDGYTEEDWTRPGADTNNITIEDSAFSTSRANIVRIGFRRKIFNSRGFTMRNCDILHGAIGEGGETFALLGMWGDNGANGDHSEISFENITLDNWYSLAQIVQQQGAVHGVIFRNIWALDQPPLRESTLTANVKDVTFENIKFGQTTVTRAAQLPLVVSGGADAPKFAPPKVKAAFTVEPVVIRPNEQVTFTAQAVPDAKYTWRFGDGTEAEGRLVQHCFGDALGTELDGANGAGRFRVLLHVTDKAGHQDWAAQGVVVVDRWHEAARPAGAATAGLEWRIYAGSWAELPDFTKLQPALTGTSPNLQAGAQGITRWATVWDGWLNVPADGGYTFHLIDRDGARLVIDGVEVAKTGPPFSPFSPSRGYALRYDRRAIGLRAGLHSIRIEGLNTISAGAPRLMWEGPGVKLGDVPEKALMRKR